MCRRKDHAQARHRNVRPARLRVAPAQATDQASTTLEPADAFVAALSTHCGKAYAGRIVANEPAAAPEPHLIRSKASRW